MIDKCYNNELSYVSNITFTTNDIITHYPHTSHHVGIYKTINFLFLPHSPQRLC